jgi:hypothetical protein
MAILYRCLPNAHHDCNPHRNCCHSPPQTFTRLLSLSLSLSLSLCLTGFRVFACYESSFYGFVGPRRSSWWARIAPSQYCLCKWGKHTRFYKHKLSALSLLSLSLSLSMSTWIALGFVRAVSRLLLGFCGDLEEALEGRTVPTHCKSGEHKLYKSYLLLLAICRNWRERYIQLLSGILFCFRGRSLSASSDDQVLHLQFASFIPSFPHDFSEFVDVFMVCSCFASWLVFVLRIYRGWVSADGA